MEVTMYLDKGDALREEGFFESKVTDLENQIKALQYDNAQLTVRNGELSERVKKLATRTPAWPKGYTPRRHDRFKKRG
tara:strand:- start:291 stop:524 length:234 start_codon:yes stop_codon:yes gene_type:complete